jgi:hypothetical protein
VCACAERADPCSHHFLSVQHELTVTIYVYWLCRHEKRESERVRESERARERESERARERKSEGVREKVCGKERAREPIVSLMWTQHDRGRESERARERVRVRDRE